jgi:hypothetical protein
MKTGLRKVFVDRDTWRSLSQANQTAWDKLTSKAMGYTTKVLYKDEVGTIKEAKEQAKQEEAYFAENTSRFTQSENMPFLQSPERSHQCDAISRYCPEDSLWTV